MGRAARETTTPSPPACACSVGGWPVFHEAKRARTVLHRSQRRWPIRFEAAAADLLRCWHRRGSANGVGRRASRVGREENHVKSASKRVLRVPTAGSPRDEATAGRAAQESISATMRFRSRRRRPGAGSFKKRLGQRCGMERIVR